MRDIQSEDGPSYCYTYTPASATAAAFRTTAHILRNQVLCRVCHGNALRYRPNAKIGESRKYVLPQQLVADLVSFTCISKNGKIIQCLSLTNLFSCMSFN